MPASSAAEMRPVDARDAREYLVDDPVVWIEPQVGDEPLRGRSRVVAEEAGDADSDGERHHTADEFEGADHLEAEIAGFRRSVHVRPSFDRSLKP